MQSFIKIGTVTRLQKLSQDIKQTNKNQRIESAASSNISEETKTLALQLPVTAY